MRREQTSPAILGHAEVRLIEILSIPELACDLAVSLIERFAVIGVGTAAYFFAPPESHFAKPIRIGEGLARHSDNVSVTTSENRFGLIKCRDAAGRDDRRFKSG